MSRLSRLVRGLVTVLAIVAIASCAAQKSYHTAEREMRREDYDRAVLSYTKALAMDPGNTRYSVALERAKLKASSAHFQKGARFAAAGQLELAIAEFQQTLLLNPGNQHAGNELERVMRDLLRRDAGPSEIELLKDRAARADLGPPRLDPATNIRILLNFQEVEVSKIFEAISKASGINFIFDEKVDMDTPMTIDIGNVTLEKALDILMLQTKNFYKVIDEYTLLLAPDTRQKRQEYDDQVIRTFFLSNAETKTVVTLLRSLLQSRQIAENPELNSVTIKDTPAKVAIAERIINANDKSKGEVLIDVELLEINRTVAKTLGIDLTSKTLFLTFRDGEESVPLNNLSVLKQSGNWAVSPIPGLVLDFLKSDSETKAIAKPQLRVQEGERAEILIGDRVPIPTTSFNTSQTVGGNIVPITSFTYQNVGITVQIEPRVHHNKEVTLNVQVEVSQISAFVETGGGQSQPIIGTRQIQSVLRLRDGETNLLAGLISRSDQDSLSGVPGLMDIPGVRRLFGTTTTENRETDIVMTLTPRIIRMPDITEEDLMTLWVGTEENMGLRGPARDAFNAGPFSGSASAPAGAPPAREGGGSVAQISASDEVQRDRERTEREASAPAQDPQQQQEEQEQQQQQDQQRQQQQDEPAGRDTEREEEPQGVALVLLKPSKGTYSVGENIVVEVVIANAQNVGSTPFHLNYNKEVLQFLPPAGEGPFMKADGANTVFLASDTGGGGKVVVGLSRMGAPEGVRGSGTLAILQFVATNPGDCRFSFSGASIKDPNARNLPANFQTAHVTVQP